jgi:hypothetical protein
MRYTSLLLSPALIAAGLTFPQEAKAWGEFGHLTVCDLAYRNFTPATRKTVKSLFGNGVTISAHGETRTYTSFNVGCLEEDERPRRNPKDHFLNVARTLPAIPNDLCPASEPTGQPLKCIRRDTAVLADGSRSRQDRVVALLALGHWVGDIHQPLHISYEDDVGGNSIDVSFKGKCGTGSTGSPYRPGSFHAVWDNCLLENGIFERVRKRSDYKPSWSRRTITYRAVDTLDANTSVAEKRQFASSAPWQWAAESYEIARRADVEYCVMVGGACQYTATIQILPDDGEHKKVRVDAAYLDRFKGVAEERVRRAGMRLAHLVNEALDPDYTEPED